MIETPTPRQDELFAKLDEGEIETVKDVAIEFIHLIAEMLDVVEEASNLLPEDNNAIISAFRVYEAMCLDADPTDSYSVQFVRSGVSMILQLRRDVQSMFDSATEAAEAILREEAGA